MKHIMLDLETLGTTPGCAILSIGAVEFLPLQERVLGCEFYKNISLKSNLEVGLKVEEGSFYWWLTQNEHARKAVCINRFDLKVTLQSFINWCQADTFLWSHGASFDLAVLAAAYQAVGLDRPWIFRNERDTRTLLAQANMKMPSTDNSHHALHDAKSQAETITQAMKKLDWYG